MANRTDLLVRSPQTEKDAVFSSDGRWIAYVSDETGQSEVYARPFRSSGEKVRISTAGGSQPRWRRDGKELFYLSADNHLTAVTLTLGDSLQPASPVALFLLQTGSVYDSPDGQRFLVSSAAHESAGTTVMVNWTARLAKH